MLLVVSVESSVCIFQVREDGYCCSPIDAIWTAMVVINLSLRIAIFFTLLALLRSLVIV